VCKQRPWPWFQHTLHDDFSIKVAWSRVITLILLTTGLNNFFISSWYSRSPAVALKERNETDFNIMHNWQLAKLITNHINHYFRDDLIFIKSVHLINNYLFINLEIHFHDLELRVELCWYLYWSIIKIKKWFKTKKSIYKSYPYLIFVKYNFI